jgi:hypothetical protein
MSRPPRRNAPLTEFRPAAVSAGTGWPRLTLPCVSLAAGLALAALPSLAQAQAQAQVQAPAGAGEARPAAGARAPAPLPAPPTPPAPVPAATPAAAPTVLVRSGQHADRGRLVLHLGQIPGYSLTSQGQDHTLRLRGTYRLDLENLRRLSEVAGVSVRQEGEDTVLRVRSSCDCVAESGSVGGLLYIDLRPGPAPRAAAREPRGSAPIATARKRVLDDAVRMGLMSQEQAAALLRNTQPGPAAAPSPAATSPTVPSPGAPAPVVAVPPAPASSASISPAPASPALARPAQAAAQGGRQPPAATPAAAAPAASRGAGGDLAALRSAMLSQLALLNGAPPPRAPAPAPAPALTTPPASVPNPSFAPDAAASFKPVCDAPFSLGGWRGEDPYRERLSDLRGTLARSDSGAAEIAALAEFQIGHELLREALALLSTPMDERPDGALRGRLERARDVARLLSRQPIDEASPLLAELPDCAREDLPLWRALAAAVRQDAAGLARLAPQARAALRRVPQDLRIAFAAVLADAVDEDTDTLRTIVGAIRAATGLRPDQAALRDWLLARLARLEGNRGDEVLYLERAAGLGRTLPALFANARLAALNFGKPGAEGQRAEMQLVDFTRTYRYDPLGEEAAVLYTQRLMERGALAEALAVADAASQASVRPRVESRAARQAVQLLRLLLVDAKGMVLPDPAQRLALYWQYEGYATPGERGDDIRLGAMRLMLDQGLGDAALDLGRSLTPAVAQKPDTVLLIARAEASAAQGDPQRALALLQGLPPADDSRRASSAALQRLNRPLEAAQALEGLQARADLGARAALYFQARAWGQAATAYGELLRDPALEPAARSEATARLASASALAGQRAGVAPELLVQQGGSAALLQLAAQPAAAAPPGGVAAARAAIARSRQIEALLPPASAPQSGRN